MCDIGIRLRLPDGRVYADGSPLTPGATGMVVGHVGASAIVSVDERPTEYILVPDVNVRPIRGTAPRPVIIMPGGRAHPLNRSWPRARTRR